MWRISFFLLISLLKHKNYYDKIVLLINTKLLIKVRQNLNYKRFSDFFCLNFKIFILNDLV